MCLSSTLERRDDMKAVNLGTFLRDLPKLASGASNVVVATYNNLDSHPNGGTFNVGGKTLTILCGGASYAHIEDALGCRPNPEAPPTKTAGAKKVSEGLASIDADSLVVLYAGKSRFSEMVRLAYNLAERGIKVALVGCGCDDYMLRTLIKDYESITWVSPTHGGCNGGRGDLSDIVAVLLS